MYEKNGTSNFPFFLAFSAFYRLEGKMPRLSEVVKPPAPWDGDYSYSSLMHDCSAYKNPVEPFL